MSLSSLSLYVLCACLEAKVAEMSSLRERHDLKTETLAAKLKTVASEISETKGKMDLAAKEIKKASEAR